MPIVRRSSLVLVAVLLAASPRAAGLLVPAAGGDALAIESQEIVVDVFDGLATTEVTQVFRNDGASPLEAVYSFPLPPHASLTGFTAWIAGREMTGEVLPRDVARKHYQEIVHPSIEPQRTEWSFLEGLVDPGLLEEVSPREFRATIFPVPASGVQRIRVSYVEQLRVARDLVRYVLPLQTARAERSLVEGSFSIRLEVRSTVPLADVDFPGTWRESVSAEQSSPHRLTAVVTRPDGSLDDDFVATWQLAREAPGLDLVTHRVAGEDGTFLLLATAPFEEAPAAPPSAWTVVVDVSGSMQRRRRLDVAAEALERFLETCDDDDLVNVIAFNVRPVAFSQSPLPNERATREQAARWLRSQRAVGGTALLPALEMACALRARDRENALVIVSDGGLGDSELSHGRHLELVSDCGLRVFGLAIGNDANAPLLQALAARTGGFTAEVSTREDLLVRGRQLRDRLRTRPWRRLRLEVSPGAQVADVAPAELPDLWPGEQVIVTGRYRGRGPATFTLAGERDGRPESLATSAHLPLEATLHPEIRRAWAEGQVTDLEQAIRRGDAPADAEARIERLGVEHSIVTSRTSFLVLENDRMYEERGIERRSRAILEDERRAREERRETSDAAPVDAMEVVRPPRSSGGSLGGGALGPLELALALAWLALLLVVRRARP